MIYLALLTGPYSPAYDLPGKGANGPEEPPMQLERADLVPVTCELVEEIVKSIMNNPPKKDKTLPEKEE